MGLQRVRRNWATKHSTAKQHQPSALLDFINETVEEGIKEEMSNTSLILKIKVQTFFKFSFYFILDHSWYIKYNVVLSFKCTAK